ncbi:MAG: VOC family protein [Vicinamibacterales bacterium]
MPSRLDHLVYAVPDLEQAIDDLAVRLGVRAAIGGRHPGRGTHNALIALGPASYLEIVAPDPSQPAPVAGRWFGVDGLASGPRLVTWAATARDLPEAAARAAEAGVRFGEIGEGSRARPDGSVLRWRFTDPTTVIAGGVVPFLIDWAGDAHPAHGAPGGVRVAAFGARHPDPPQVLRWLAALELELPVAPGDAPSLHARLRGPAGDVDLR